MHLLAGETGRIEDGQQAVDLDQPPGDIVFLSAADSELAALARAAAHAGGPSLRLANLARLTHPLSIDLYAERTLRHARLVVVRMMGGAGYWPYGLETLRALARGGGPALAVIPGDAQWDAGLEAFTTIDGESARRLWRYLVEGGQANVDHAFAFMAHIIGQGAVPPAPEVLARAGYYKPGRGPVGFRDLALDPDRPVAALVFYRALLDGASSAPIDALAEALAAEGIAALPIFVASLKDRESEGFLADAFERTPPSIVLNTTSFAVSKLGVAHGGTVLDLPGKPVLQVILAGSSEEAWRASPPGLAPRDLTMNVVLPEVDGRLVTRAVSFKAEVAEGGATATVYRPLADRIAFVAALAAAWVRLAAKPPPERRVALVLSNYPDRAGRIANGVGLDTPASAVRIAEAMAGAGYDVEGFPDSSASLMALLTARSTSSTVIPAEAGSHRSAASIGRDEAGMGAGAMDPGFRRHDDTEGRDASPPSAAGAVLPLAAYAAFLATMPASLRDALAERWGAPQDDPHFTDGAFRLRIHRFGNVVVGIQPARGYGVDPKATFHDPALVPPHRYLAFYAWLRTSFGVDAIVQVGKHGNLEWLPGKALGLSAECWPEAALGPTPLIYPFIVNDPGEGSQAKRRSAAVIVDHLMPAMTRAETHGGLAELETLIDEYYVAAGIDERRRAWLEGEILALAESTGIAADLGLVRADTPGTLQALDAHLCDIKELQIRDGLHVLGAGPTGRECIDTLAAIARVPRSGGHPEDASLQRAIAEDLALGFVPLSADPAAPWTGPRPAILAALSAAPWRIAGDTTERIEMLAAKLIEEALGAKRTITSPLAPSPSVIPAKAGIHRSAASAADDAAGTDAGALDPGFRRDDGLDVTNVGKKSQAIIAWIAATLAPALDRSGGDEIAAVLAALDGRFVQPGPSGAPTRGRPDVLPTGRNFYSVDVRAVPTAAAWAVGKAAADAMALRYFQDEGEWPRAVALSAWSTSNMRTGGDDVAQALALIGAMPEWERGTGRVTGFRILSLAELGRPRIDVTLKISGMFRDAFPGQIDLLDSAIRSVAALAEDETANPIAASVRDEVSRLRNDERRATLRIFGARPGTYGTGLQTPMDEELWTDRADLAEIFTEWGAHAYGSGHADSEAVSQTFRERLKAIQAVIQPQDNREHDILDSDEYWQFAGGLATAVERHSGVPPRLYHSDTSSPERPRIRPFSEEIGRVVRGRAANPKWLSGMMRHGYKGASEMAATVDHLYAFAATTNAVGDHHFDLLYQALIENAEVRDFLLDANPAALREMGDKFRRAIERGLWSPRSNSAYDRLSALIREAHP